MDFGWPVKFYVCIDGAGVWMVGMVVGPSHMYAESALNFYYILFVP